MKMSFISDDGIAKKNNLYTSVYICRRTPINKLKWSLFCLNLPASWRFGAFRTGTPFLQIILSAKGKPLIKMQILGTIRSTKPSGKRQYLVAILICKLATLRPSPSLSWSSAQLFPTMSHNALHVIRVKFCVTFQRAAVEDTRKQLDSLPYNGGVTYLLRTRGLRNR